MFISNFVRYEHWHIFIWTLGWTLASHLPETYFLFKNLSLEVWRHFRAMRIFCIDGHYFAFLKIMKILKLLFYSQLQQQTKKSYSYIIILLKVVQTIKLSFSISRELNKFVPRAFCLSNIGWYQRRSYSLLSDSRKRKTKSPRNEVGS